ncbi:hypothetical protein HL653_09625 [Sphingomonas sp. AP4-R1]|uniref:hypothetical protein n=1 Tax=Sphingomonas sp. AP4-R1 TaxID=2735134 RepID=UPI0014939E10|nr:hypothetical protein [Sphingomonas sp. AP4-R1]QJU58022.1 hypothetical protein HL653_09625 [Sphingomonas sp. AP4-R1]
MSGRSRERRMRGNARDALVEALAARGGDGAVVRARPSHDWASATFAGARHRLEIRLPAEAADAFARGLGEAEFSLRGHLLADIAIVDRGAADGEVLLEVEALTIEES